MRRAGTSSRPGLPWCWLVLAAAALTGACAAPARPHRLGSPLLGGARLPDGWRHDPGRAPEPPGSPEPGDETQPPSDQPVPSRVATGQAGSPPSRERRPGAPPLAVPPVSRSLPLSDDEPLPVCSATVAAPCLVRVPDSLDLAALASPHRETDKIAPADILERLDLREAGDLRRLVGQRVEGSAMDLALFAAARLTGGIPPALSAGPDLIAWADGNGALDGPRGEVRPGDLLVFDRAVAGEPASLVAIVVGRDGRGVIEMIYVGGGVVRRGFVDPSRPRVVRDADRRIVNSYLRHGRDWPPSGTRFLSGELLVHVIRVR